MQKKGHIRAHFPMIYPSEFKKLLHSKSFHAVPEQASKKVQGGMKIFPLSTILHSSAILTLCNPRNKHPSQCQEQQ